ncbi:PepSY domain-containing protein [Burkholderia sp. B21-007]|uniref:PepSY-associated TM helix domain-containing protein n=1 Tax=unclassified Burkholderia TaxID=2613784 RepID=UPI003A5CCE91|nr:PepSY domain-containing protein [Burkholderia sp. B21-007]UEP45577.1 PepSY domain-containing protein [Burkholderia sp. B21-005]
MRRHAGSKRRTVRTAVTASGCTEGEPGFRFPATTVWVDAYTGAIVGARDVAAQSTGDTFLAWLHPLHSGEALGLSGRIAVLVSGLALPLLFVTGILRWRHKNAVKRAGRSEVAIKVGESAPGGFSFAGEPIDLPCRNTH